MLFLKKCWDWCVEHWKLSLAFIGGIIAFVLGYLQAMRDPPRENPMNDVIKKDNELMKKKSKEQEDFVQKKALDFIEHKKKIEISKIEKLRKAEEKSEKLKEDLLNSEEKLDKMLKEKFDLNKE